MTWTIELAKRHGLRVGVFEVAGVILATGADSGIHAVVSDDQYTFTSGATLAHMLARSFGANEAPT